jgi:hypothetical protein
MKPVLPILTVLLVSCFGSAQAPPKSVTVPITLDHNRTIIDVYFPLPDGKTKRVRGWVDNGNADLWITEALAKTLSLPLHGDPKPTLGGHERSAQAPAELEIGGLTISLAGIKEAHAVLDRESIAPGCSAEINIPSMVLRNYDVLLDYPNRQLSIAAPGSMQFKGTRNQAMVNSENGLIQIASKIGGHDYNLALDMGASITLISADLMAQWHRAQPAWPHLVGAVGAANMWGEEAERHWELLRIPAIQYGSTPLSQVAAAAFPDQSLKWFEDRAGLPTIGLIGANALLDRRIGLDYAHSTVYLERTNPTSAPDMDVVGLILRPEADEHYTVLGVADFDGKPSVPQVKRGDVLLAVEGAPATGATMGQVWSLLGGRPGQTRSLLLERDGKRFTVDAAVHRFLSADFKKHRPGNAAQKTPKTNSPQGTRTNPG